MAILITTLVSCNACMEVSYVPYYQYHIVPPKPLYHDWHFYDRPPVRMHRHSPYPPAPARPDTHRHYMDRGFKHR